MFSWPTAHSLEVLGISYAALTRLLRPSEEPNEAMADRGPDGRMVPRGFVESTHANELRCDQIAREPNPQTEPLVTVPQLFERSDEHEVSTRDRPARTEADARIEESAAIGEVRLATRPYGRKWKAKLNEERKRITVCPWE